MRYILHGGRRDLETEEAERVLRDSGISYRVERASIGEYDGELVLVTSAGRFTGLQTIKDMFERGK